MKKIRRQLDIFILCSTVSNDDDAKGSDVPSTPIILTGRPWMIFGRFMYLK